MTLGQLASRNLVFHRRIYIAVALGVMSATAVLTGALLVGDSVQGSLRELALNRLGRIDAALVTPRFFRQALAEDVAAYRDTQRPETRILARPAMLLQATLTTGGSGEHRAADHVTVLGAGEAFWNFDPAGPQPQLRPGEIVLNAPLAEQLGVKSGDEVIVRLPLSGYIPAESALGRKNNNVKTLPALRVSQVIPADRLGRFALYPSQQVPYNAFVSLADLQDKLDQPGKANAIFASILPADSFSLDAQQTLLAKALRPTLADYGLSIAKTSDGYFNFTTDRMLLDATTERAAENAFRILGGQPTLTYLANYIMAGDGKAKIPYSTVTALDLRTEPPLGPFLTPDGQTIEPLADDEIVLNSWTADDMAAQGVKLKPGDTISLQYFEPESLHGETNERTATFKLKAIAELAGAAADPNLTPELKGVTDQKSIADWNPPFKFDASRVRSRPPHNQDEAYWQKYHATPKAFVSLAAGRRLWHSRFGDTTSWRIPAKDGLTAEQLADRLKLQPATMGFTFLPVKMLALQAASGTTPFDMLFLGFSFFIIAAAVMLVALLFKLGVDGRASEIGALLALGFRRRAAQGMLLREGLVVSLAGAGLGVLAGLGYAWLMLVGLRTWWLAAIVTPFLELHVTVQSLAIGFVSGVVVSLLTIALSLRQATKTSVRRLLSGEASEPVAGSTTDGGQTAARGWKRFWAGARRWMGARMIAIGCFVAAFACGAFAGSASGEERAGMFFGSGFFMLVAVLALVWRWLSRAPTERSSTRGTLARLAIRNGARRPLRSTLTIGLMATASFLIASVSAFHIAAPSAGADLHSGEGGFSLWAQSDQPIYLDLNNPSDREDLGFSSEAEKIVAASQIFPLRVHSGDDASCLNLYQPRQPQVIGVSPELVARGGFAWTSTAATTPEDEKNPWLLLNPHGRTRDAAREGDGAIPVVMDEAMALYSLHLSGVGDTYEITDGGGQRQRLRIVGLLDNSLFQGSLLMSEADLLRLFPSNSGYRMFLIDPKGQPANQVRQALESGLVDYGFDVEPTARRLEALAAVQNTYLSTFQTLGGLGLLLGMVGLAVVQLRSVLERRGELALMRAVGFRRRRLAEMVVLENGALLVIGLACGVLSALVAIAPQWFSSGAPAPWMALAGTLALVLIVGLGAGLLAAEATLRAPLIPALREE